MIRADVSSPAGCLLLLLITAGVIVLLPVLLVVLLISALIGRPVSPTFHDFGDRWKKKDSVPDDDNVIDVEAEVVEEKEDSSRKLP